MHSVYSVNSVEQGVDPGDPGIADASKALTHINLGKIGKTEFRIPEGEIL